MVAISPVFGSTVKPLTRQLPTRLLRTRLLGGQDGFTVFTEGTNFRETGYVDLNGYVDYLEAGHGDTINTPASVRLASRRVIGSSLPLARRSTCPFPPSRSPRSKRSRPRSPCSSTVKRLVPPTSTPPSLPASTTPVRQPLQATFPGRCSGRVGPADRHDLRRWLGRHRC